jgi:hypothetical protein
MRTLSEVTLAEVTLAEVTLAEVTLAEVIPDRTSQGMAGRGFCRNAA